jgi:hypothetical protein
MMVEVGTKDKFQYSGRSGVLKKSVWVKMQTKKAFLFPGMIGMLLAFMLIIAGRGGVSGTGR